MKIFMKPNVTQMSSKLILQHKNGLQSENLIFSIYNTKIKDKSDDCQLS